MLGSFPSLLGAIALAFATSVNAQLTPTVQCGGTLQVPGSHLDVKYFDGFTSVTVKGLNQNTNSETYVLYCTADAPAPLTLMNAGLPSDNLFKVPLTKVAVEDTYTLSYIELIGKRDTIVLVSNPQNVVSPCIQQRISAGFVSGFVDSNPVLYTDIDAAFQENQHAAQTKDIWMPHGVDIAPLERAEFIKAVALFFNDGPKGENVYLRIKASYEGFANDMARIPPQNKKRIGWVQYDFSTSRWVLRNSLFTKAIIEAAGGIAFPMETDMERYPDYSPLSADDIKNIILNSQVVIDQTDFSKAPRTPVFIQQWRTLAGFSLTDSVPVISNHAVYSLDNTQNRDGSSDYNYRLASRPDLLVMDVIRAQYGGYNPGYNMTFLNRQFSYEGGPGNRLTQDDCPTNDYNGDDIQTYFGDANFSGDGNPPPSMSGSGLFGGSGSSGAGGEKKGGVSGIIIGVVVTAVVLGSIFAFAFFKWSRRAKEDRFIELEEEMNNEIPLN